ncbi:MAG: type II toxin-antitoxin system RelE/ParE family toxin [Woronichinia naegeliana WA131]|jgi:mRNA interferase RelE/StbE|uniref:Type II toxin-antitoxin system RelE/ParE family toxin n=1 Tax=Woronichinia naegeliana WA131 TaxID=2824559 RepID=A0A977L1X4_9CYAN|nr:MAG: type II toxin-antitoxin system RelE/ParE family toxin [Woronichinia naegeliana WA131]
MRHRIEFTDKAVEGLESLTAIVRERVFKKIRWMSENFDDIRHQGLSANLSGLFKLRIGDYRVIYSFDDDFITIHQVGHRQDIYSD